MTAWKHSDLTGPYGHLAPGCQLLSFDFMIIDPAVNCHRAFQRGFRMILISLAEFEIRADRRQHQIQQFVVLQRFHRSAVELTKFLDQRASRQAGERFLRASAMRRLSRRDEQMGRLAAVLASQTARCFKAQQRSQAVTEKNKGLVRVPQQFLRYGVAEWRQSSVMRFTESGATTWQMHRSHFHPRRQTLRPTMKALRAPSRIMKAEQTHLGRWIRLREKNPFV